MTRKELDIAVDWATKEGWNPGLHDADVFWNTDPKGFYALVKCEEMIGCVSGISYSGEFGFGGFFILKPGFRNQKLGTELATYFLKAFPSRLKKGAAIGGDGVFNMQPTYEKWGFKFSHRDLRMEGITKKEAFSASVSKISSKDFIAINNFDKAVFGFDRSVFLKGWLNLPESMAYKYKDGEKIKGYGVVRKCVTGYKIGLLFASDYKTAHELFKALSSYVANSLVYLDIPEINKDAVKLAKEYKMKEMFGCARMYLGSAPKLPYTKIFGVTTFELG